MLPTMGRRCDGGSGGSDMKAVGPRQLSFQFAQPSVVVAAKPAAAPTLTVAECRRILHTARSCG
jgi:hypothetical protein